MTEVRRNTTGKTGRILAAAALLALAGGMGRLAASPLAPITRAAAPTCRLSGPTGPVKHVIYLQFDNFHFSRDNPRVPSDLEQVPSLLNFIKGNGTLLTNEHTPLISHTADDFITSFTGLYGSHHGMPVSNSYRYFNPDGSSGSQVSWAYWTDRMRATNPQSTDNEYNLTNQAGLNTPAPWVPYTRAGCSFGGVGGANLEVENTNHDVAALFGPNSMEAQEVRNPKLGDAFSDFLGIGVHCAKGDPICSTANHGIADLLPSEPGGYSGYQVSFGHKYVAPQINPAGQTNRMTDLDGHLIANVYKGHVNPGFPGFDALVPSVALSYVAAMQEHNVPVTYAYITNAHNPNSLYDPSNPNSAYGPGAAGYEKNLRAFDRGFKEFFARMAKDGINTGNTLFVFTSDENDHFAGGAPTPAGCDGVHVPCNYSKIGEISANLNGIAYRQSGVPTSAFDARADVAPTIYIRGNPASGSPASRQVARALGHMTALSPISGQTDVLVQRMANPLQLRLLHMVTADPRRTPNLTLFLNPNYYAGGPLDGLHNNCDVKGNPDPTNPCVFEDTTNDAYNHGSYQPEITTTWLGFAGPGIRQAAPAGNVFADETDIRPTMMSLTGLKDDYAHDGRTISEVLSDAALPAPARGSRGLLERLGQAYKAIDAPVGPLCLDTLQISTTALESADPTTYARLEGRLTAILARRDALAQRMLMMIEGASFGNAGVPAEASTLITQAEQLVGQVRILSAQG